ncbi:hypothetical protein GGU10DRAFT_380406 [Lentinula aff. detonsa]|uniref:Uncharacterized protein n=1 Tax=Lentinula aff. detonsa TaxID=2804958 RepID=A0AA38KNC6_9AGAR|nr:hypothetical protein GGU10DRAFT_380406 [Lentinula aff. detonsa]
MSRATPPGTGGETMTVGGRGSSKSRGEEARGGGDSSRSRGEETRGGKVFGRGTKDERRMTSGRGERIVEERRVVEEQKRKQEALAEKRKNKEVQLVEAKQREAERVAEEAATEVEENQARNTAYAKLVEENKKEKEKAAKELAKWQKHVPATKQRQVDVVIPPRPLGSKKKHFKSKSVISDKSDEEGREVVPAPQGEKRKQMVRMIPKGGILSNLDGEYDPENEQGTERHPDAPSPSRPACSQCIMIGRPSECRPQSLQRQAQALRAKWVKLDDEGYEGPAARVGESVTIMRTSRTHRA